MLVCLQDLFYVLTLLMIWSLGLLLAATPMIVVGYFFYLWRAFRFDDDDSDGGHDSGEDITPGPWGGPNLTEKEFELLQLRLFGPIVTEQECPEEVLV